MDTDMQELVGRSATDPSVAVIPPIVGLPVPRARRDGLGGRVTAPSHLRAEHRVDALGIGERRPRLSWRLPAGAATQRAYELSADDGVSLRVESDANVLVPWPGDPLASGERREVRVRVWTDLGESE